MMSQWREDILLTTSSTEPNSFYLWISLLNVFEKHKDDLDLEDIEIIVDKVEECRIYLNKHSSSYIEQQEVYPNVYKHLENMKRSRSDNQVQSSDNFSLLSPMSRCTLPNLS